MSMMTTLPAPGTDHRNIPFFFIQHGIDNAADNDTVIVRSGIYMGQRNRDLDFHGKALTLRSESGAAATIINCLASETNPHRGIHFKSNEPRNSVVDGFTITNGVAQDGGGIVEGFGTPVKWDVEKSENVLWKTPLDGLGHSSPAIWGNRIFVTIAINTKGPSDLKVGLYGDVESASEDAIFIWRIYCIDTGCGKILWDKTIHQGKPRMKRHPKSGHANSTPCTDGKYVVVFLASEGLYCYDMEGKLIWRKDLGLLDYSWYV